MSKSANYHPCGGEDRRKFNGVVKGQNTVKENLIPYIWSALKVRSGNIGI